MCSCILVLAVLAYHMWRVLFPQALLLILLFVLMVRWSVHVPAGFAHHMWRALFPMVQFQAPMHLLVLALLSLPQGVMSCIVLLLTGAMLLPLGCTPVFLVMFLVRFLWDLVAVRALLDRILRLLALRLAAVRHLAMMPSNTLARFLLDLVVVWALLDHTLLL